MDKSERMKICKQCALYNGGICNSHLYCHPLTNEVSSVPKEGYKRGCGCVIKHKVGMKYASCPLEKW